jgi:acyl-CoA thioester hydrolase
MSGLRKFRRAAQFRIGRYVVPAGRKSGGAGRAPIEESCMTAPTPCLEIEIPAAWLDYNEHLNDAYHAVAFSQAGDAFMDRVGLGAEGRRATGRTIYTLALVIRYLAEVKRGDRLAIAVRVLETDGKRLRLWLEARRGSDGALASTSEQVMICVDRAGDRPRAADFPPAVAAILQAIAAVDAESPTPLEAGQGLTLRRRSPSSVTP